MAVMLIKSNNNLKNLVNYINDNERHKGEILYCNGIGIDPQNAITDMELCKYAYDKGADRGAKHIVVSLEKGEEELLDVHEVCTVANNIAGVIYSNTGCQLAYAVHGNTDKLHIHYAVNSVRIDNGHKIQINRADTINMKKEISMILGEHGLKPVKFESKNM